MSKQVESKVSEFLALPHEALPGAMFTEDEDSWAADAWAVLRQHAKTGEPIAALCGTKIRLVADRAEWRGGVVVG